MTTEEKLKAALDFIHGVEALDVNQYDIVSARTLEDDVHGYCSVCNEEVDDVQLCWPSIMKDKKYIDMDAVDQLKDRAWHLLADLAT